MLMGILNSMFAKWKHPQQVNRIRGILDAIASSFKVIAASKIVG